MILAEKITILRKRNGWSQEELAEQLGVSRQAISKWESAQSTPDLKRILAMAEAFGVSTDILLKDEEPLQELPAYTETEITAVGKLPEAEPLRSVSMEEANDFLALKAVSAGRTAIGVMLCILSPILLILLSTAQEMGLVPLTEMQAAGFGILVLMLLVGAAVALFVYDGMKLGRFDYIEKEALETAYGVEGMVRDRMERYSSQHIRYMVIGILLCVLSCIPLFVSMILNDENEMSMSAALCILLAMVAVGVLLIVRTSIMTEAMQSLLEEGDYSRAQKRENRRNEAIMGIYWGSAAALYLLVSFLTGRWDMTWIIWPVAGVGCGVLAAVLKVIRSRE